LEGDDGLLFYYKNSEESLLLGAGAAAFRYRTPGKITTVKRTTETIIEIFSP
jgi:hypothetical protein